MSSSNDMLDAIFGEITNDKILVKDDKKESDYYRPRIKDGKDSYEAIIKFLPNLKDTSKSIVNKWTIFLDNPVTTEKKMVDCPSTIKQKSILQDLYFALKNSEDASENDLKDKFSRKQQFYSLVQIIEDKQNPELEGKIKIFQYGVQVYDIIEKIMNPKTSHKEANNPFKLFSGKSFELLIEKQGSGYPKYTSSSFLNKTHNLVINGKEVSNDPKHGNKIIEFFDNWPDKLLENEFKEWDDDLTSFIISTINDIVPNGKTLKQVFRKYPDFVEILNGLETNSTSNLNISKAKKRKVEDDEEPIKKTKSIPKIKKVEITEDEDDLEEDDDEIDDFIGNSIDDDDDDDVKSNKEEEDDEDDEDFFK